jgi:hypothetical protein
VLSSRSPAPGVERAVAAAPASIQGLTGAVVEAVAYADVFDWPLTPAEIHAYLPVAAGRTDVDAALEQLRRSSSLTAVGPFVVLAGREDLADGRRHKAAISRRLWPAATRYGRVVATLPWVRLVAVTGSLAVGAATDDADIDLLIVTVDGRLWLARAMTIGVGKLAARAPSSRGVRLCPNYLLTASTLDLPERDLYTAHELAQLVPLFGPEAYRELLARNGWYRQFLPNHPGHVGAIGPLGLPRLHHAVEPILRNRLVGRLERWEMDRKIARLRVESATGEVRFDESICKGHFEGYRQQVLAAFDARLVERRQW